MIVKVKTTNGETTNQPNDSNETERSHGSNTETQYRSTKEGNTNETLIYENCRLASETLTGLRDTERNLFRLVFH
jgi:hypothetical protein